MCANPGTKQLLLEALGINPRDKAGILPISYVPSPAFHFYFEIRSHNIVQAGLEFAITFTEDLELINPLPQPSTKLGL